MPDRMTPEELDEIVRHNSSAAFPHKYWPKEKIAQMVDEIRALQQGVARWKETVESERRFSDNCTLKFEKEKLERDKAALVEALTDAQAHLEELRDAWKRGCITEHDGKGGIRSNRNAEVERHARKVLEEVSK